MPLTSDRSAPSEVVVVTDKAGFLSSLDSATARFLNISARRAAQRRLILFFEEERIQADRNAVDGHRQLETLKERLHDRLRVQERHVHRAGARNPKLRHS